MDADLATRGASLVAAILVALAWPHVATGDVGLIVRRSVARPGETMTVWGGCGYPIYLVRTAASKRLAGYGPYHSTIRMARPPRRAPFRRLGLPTCTGREHFVGDYPNGDWSSWGAYLRFRVPRVRPGRYELAGCGAARSESGRRR